ncbi:vitelline membrane outer layer protein 1 homolog isoform X1 [Megalobrama amblycephala]|uniref:vitelline membrane outer layer protein 1 homolog isoform X1 n=1 Tax=Megalobrama amblycephala TaxID=75352 RepID=UPI0020143FE0|nr:vitelline membrane outer layer protein 1 homolog isoform X1 [Megalobrama amblycephala]
MHHFISFAFTLLAIIGLHVSVQSTGNFVSLLTVTNGMEQGSWGERELCPIRTYAAGFRLKVEKPHVSDNTALNGIRLYCVSQTKDLLDSNEDTFVQSDVGSWGEWTDAKWCPSGFLTAFQLRVQSAQKLQDNTAANNIKFKCSQGDGTDLLLQGDGTDRGEWGDWSPLCQGKGICGIRTRVEKSQGYFIDDTALNDARMFCCD